MISALFGLIAAAQAALLVLAVRGGLRAPDRILLAVSVVPATLVYDNTVIALGSALGRGPLLEGLNAGRFAGHALFTPLLIIVGVLLGARTGAAFLARRGVLATAGVLTLLLIALGVQADVVSLRLEPESYAGTLRYVNAASHGPPIPAVVAIIVLIAVGAIVWRRAGRPWLLAGAAAMFVAAGAGSSLPWLQNLGELALLAAVVRTALDAAVSGKPRLRPQA